jgi:hypothetical protein
MDGKVGAQVADKLRVMTQSSVVVAALIPNSLIPLHIIRETGESVGTLQLIVGEAAMK